MDRSAEDSAHDLVTKYVVKYVQRGVMGMISSWCLIILLTLLITDKSVGLLADFLLFYIFDQSLYIYQLCFASHKKIWITFQLQT